MKERKNNVNTLLWLMVTLSVMIVFLTLSSCKSSVNPDGKGSKTPDDPNIPPAQKITITYSCSNNNGTIEAKVISSKEGKIEGNKIINLVSGDKVQFTAKPNNGYKFKGWVPATLGNKETFELTVDKEINISAEFEKDSPKFKITKDSPIVYKTSGLGFGKKGNDGKIYYAISDYEEGKDNGLVGDDLAGDNHPTGNKAPFTSIREGLETRWNSFINYSNSEGLVPYKGKNLVKMFSSNRYLILLEDNNKINLYVYNENAYADYIVVFINKKEESDPSSDEIYWFNYNDDGKPYLLYDRKKISCQYSTPAPGFNPDTKDNLAGFRTITLKSMFESFLEQQEKKKEGAKEQIRSKFSPLISGNEDKYEIYIIVRQFDDGGKPQEHPMLCWRNILKFNDPFWAEKQKQP